MTHKQCTILSSGQIPQNYHTFALFDHQKNLLYIYIYIYIYIFIYIYIYILKLMTPIKIAQNSGEKTPQLLVERLARQKWIHHLSPGFEQKEII